MNWFEFLCLALATWRVSSLLVNECGPFDVFLRIRCCLGIEHDECRPVAWNGGLSALFSCVWCMSVWMGAILYGVWYLSPVPIYILAASGGAVIVQEVLSWQLKNPSRQS